MGAPEKILVIKLGALGDFVQALGPMAAIRKHHAEAHITLLTTKPFEGFGRDCGYFDEIWVDGRPGALNLPEWMKSRKKLNAAHFTRVYDLQNNDRTSFYFQLFKTPKPEWVGTAPGASHRNTSPERTAGHAFDGHVQTLGLAGIDNVKVDTLAWMQADISAFDLKEPYVLLVPGSAPDRPEKRWPAQKYGALATELAGQDFQPVLLGTDAESEVTRIIHEQCPAALNLTGQTSLAQIVTLARDAAFAIGNDTGPMHMIGPTGCLSLVLFSSHSDPVRHRPKGQDVHTLQSADLNDLNVKDVLAALASHSGENLAQKAQKI